MSETPITDIFRVVVPILMFGAGLWAGITIERGKKNAKPLSSPEGAPTSDGETSSEERKQ